MFFQSFLPILWKLESDEPQWSLGWCDQPWSLETLVASYQVEAENRAKTEFEVCKSANAKWVVYVNVYVIWGQNHLPTHRFIWIYWYTVRLMCTIWKCKDIDPRTDPHKVNFVCTVCFLVTPVLNTSRSSGITFSEIQVFKSASTSPVEATEGWLVACHSHLALLFVCASQTEHYSQATIDRYASIYLYI